MRPALDRDSAPSVPTSDIKASPSSFDTARVVEPFPLDPEYGDSLPDAAWLLGDNCTLKGISAAIGEHQSGKSGALERLFPSKAGLNSKFRIVVIRCVFVLLGKRVRNVSREC